MSGRDGSILDEIHTEEPVPVYERPLDRGWFGRIVAAACVAYAVWHLFVLNIAPLETWTFRILHVAGALAIGFVIAVPMAGTPRGPFGRVRGGFVKGLDLLAAACVAWSGAMLVVAVVNAQITGTPTPPAWVFAAFGQPLALGTALAILSSWLLHGFGDRAPLSDYVLFAASIVVAGFLLFSLDGLGLRLRAGTSFADPQNAWAAFVGVLLILELTRRVAGLALVVIAVIFVLYAFLGPWLPGFLHHGGYTPGRFFTYVYTDNGILGPTTAVSSTYIILFIIFAAFLQATKIGDYFVAFAFAIAGRARGGPAKVAVFASGLMGTINGTSAGNVVATGSITIPLMKRVGYKPQSAAAIEAGASTGGQIMPPIMGAGAFIMAEITGIPYTELVVAAVIPAILYFASIYFMVDFEARRSDLRGLSGDDVPGVVGLLRRAYLFTPIVILIYALFSGYSVIRAGTLATVAAVALSWLTPHRLGPKGLWDALSLASRMSIQIIVVCACAGIIVGVISLTGVGARFSSLLLDLADANQLLALVFAMLIAIILGMGMPTTAAYAVAASVVAPGLVRMGIEPLIAHFFVFYYAVVSAITPPVALAAYAGAGIAGSDPMRTSVASFKIGLAAFIVPFMFYYSPGLLMEANWPTIALNLATALVGVYLLSAAVQGWFFGRTNPIVRAAVFAAAIMMISGSLLTDLIGAALAIGAYAWQRRTAPAPATG